ncbi:MAG: hypothetical protein HYW05_05365 [Candidatus Diapherotrites archaeon]|nr:hypothetical protein [Candidatus Diapherotrites archaeon]
MPLIAELNSLMRRYRFTPNRKLNQCFLIDESIIKKFIHELSPKKNEAILEIAPGAGFLTLELAKKSGVIAIEQDAALFEMLKQEIAPGNANFYNGKIIEILHLLPEFSKVACSQPYALSSEEMFALLSRDFELAVLAFQVEFAEKLLAEPGFIDYSALSVMANYFYSAEMISRIPGNSFFPNAPGQIAMLKMRSRGKFPEIRDPALFGKFLRSLFRFRNKNLSNALQNISKIMGDEMPKGKIPKNSRLADEKIYLIRPKDFVNLYREIFQ